ncbi:MAG TPA: IS91 family transposase, partial [Chromatiaceae bacterium]|nr:IS91 family transposase [Chromatiaceae bacterium]
MKRDGSGFVQAPNNFLFPVRALSPVFRAIFLRELEALRAAGK